MKKMMKLLGVLLILGMLISGCGQSDGGAKSKDESTGKEANKETSDDEKQKDDDEKEYANKLEEVKGKGTLVVGTSADYPPYEFHAIIDGKDTVVGFDIELAKYIAEKLGVDIEIKELNFDAVLTGVETGMIDVGISGIGKKEDRMDKMEFSKEYYNDGTGVSEQTIMIRKKDADIYKTADDFKGKKLGAQLGSIQEGIANSLGGSEVKALSKFTDLMMELKTGKIDGLLTELTVGKGYQDKNDDLLVLDEIRFESMQDGTCVIAKKGELELIEEINKVIDEVKSNGKMDEFVKEANKLAEETAK